MKLLKWNEFIKLPPKTLCIEYKPCYMVDGMFIKLESINDDRDFMYTPLIDADDSEDDESWMVVIEDSECELSTRRIMRDGIFDYDRTFIVFDVDDVHSLWSTMEHLYVKALDRKDSL